MNIRVFLVGLAGGFIVSALLKYPLYDYLPARVIAGWPAASATTAFALAVAGLLALLLTGVAGARLSGKSGMAAGAASGAFAGLLAALTVQLLYASPAAAVWGGRELLAFGPRPAPSELEANRLFTGAVTGILLWTYVSIWLAIAAGALVGGFGGMLADAGGTPSKRLNHLWTHIVLFGMLATILSSLFGAMPFSLVEDSLWRMAGEAGIQLAASPALLYTLVVGSALVPMLFWQAVALRYLNLLELEDPQQLNKISIQIWVIGLKPLILTGLLVVLQVRVLLNPATGGVVLVSVILGIYTMWKYSLVKKSLPSETPLAPAIEPAPAARVFFWGIAALASIIVYSSAFLSSTAVMGVAQLAIPLIPSLYPSFSGSEPAPNLVELVSGFYSLQENLARVGLGAVILTTLLALLVTGLTLPRQPQSQPAAR